jgi:1-phosphofructokinase
MAALLGANVALCAALGGESGAVLRGLVAREHVDLLAVDCAGSNGVYVHLRRGGVREELARTQSPGLSRHEADELYGVTLSAALDGGLALLTGTDPAGLIEADVYRRLAGDLRSNGVVVIADLARAQLRAALEGGLDVLKISEEEVLREGWAQSPDPADLAAALDALHEAGAKTVLISRADQPALAYDGDSDRRLELTGPRVEPLEHRGAGDSMFAALGACLGEGLELEPALRVAMAAGCLNATRHGLGTGTRQEIEHLSRHVAVGALR